MNKSLQVLLGLLFLVLFGVLGFLGYQYFQGGKVTTTVPVLRQSPTPNPAREDQYSGRIACLPLKEGAAPEEEGCALGLLATDGKYYVLLKINPDTFTLKEGETVSVSGYPDNTFVSETSVYKVSGGINVASITRR